MSMYDLGEKHDYAQPASPKPGPHYHQSVTIRNARDLARHPVGKKLKFRAEGVIHRHSQDKTPDGTKATTEITLHKIGPVGKAMPTAGRMWCPKCGATGGGAFCPECGEKTVAAKGKDKTSDEDMDD